MPQLTWTLEELARVGGAADAQLPQVSSALQWAVEQALEPMGVFPDEEDPEQAEPSVVKRAKDAVQLRELATEELAPRLRECAESAPDRAELLAALRAAETAGLCGVPEAEEVRALLALPEEKLLQEQLRRATKRGETMRKF